MKTLTRCCYFFCTDCHHVFKKESNLKGWKVALLTPEFPVMISGTITCQYCGYIFQCADIYSGKYDVPERNWMELPPPYEL